MMLVRTRLILREMESGDVGTRRVERSTTAGTIEDLDWSAALVPDGSSSND